VGGEGYEHFWDFPQAHAMYNFAYPWFF